MFCHVCVFVCLNVIEQFFTTLSCPGSQIFYFSFGAKLYSQLSRFSFGHLGWANFIHSGQKYLTFLRVSLLSVEDSKTLLSRSIQVFLLILISRGLQCGWLCLCRENKINNLQGMMRYQWNGTAEPVGRLSVSVGRTKIPAETMIQQEYQLQPLAICTFFSKQISLGQRILIFGTSKKKGQMSS